MEGIWDSLQHFVRGPAKNMLVWEFFRISKCYAAPHQSYRPMSASTSSASVSELFKNFRQLISYWAEAAQPYRWYFYGIYFFYAFGISAEFIMIPIFYQKIIDGMMLAPEELASGVVAERYASLLYFVMCIGLLLVARLIGYRSGDWFFDRFRLGTVKRLEEGMFGDYLKHGRKFFVNNFAGSLLNDHRALRSAFDVFMDHGTFTLFWWFIVFTGSLIALAFIFPLGAIGILVWFIFYLTVVILVSRKKLIHERTVAKLNSSMTGLLADNLSNAMTIKTFGSEHREVSHYEDRNLERHRARHRNKFWSRWRNGLQGVMLIILDVSILVVGVRYWMMGEISPGVIVLILYYSNNISQEVWNFSRMINAMTQAYADANKFMEHIRLQPDIRDSADAQSSGIEDGQIHFKDVTFAYPDGAAVFKAFNLSISAGEKVGIVGPSGSGKSTMVTLLQRHMDVQSGAITIDGLDLRQVQQAYLRASISLVPQDPSLFHRSLRENIAYGNPSATQQEVEAAARKAQAHEFILETPNGYETTVGERGVKLSGGQRQRIAIARAILEAATSPIVIFDEATSSLDNKAEKEIQRAIDAALADSRRTGIIIAHRLSTLRSVDRIIVLDKGEIVETGTHAELMVRDGLYAELYDSQMLESAGAS